MKKTTAFQIKNAFIFSCKVFRMSLLYIEYKWVPYVFPFIIFINIITCDDEQFACVHTIFQKWKSLKQMWAYTFMCVCVCVCLYLQ